MQNILLLLSLVALGSTTDYKHFDCGTDAQAATDAFKQTLASLHSNNTIGSPGARRRAAALRARNGPIEIPLYIHMVSSAAKQSQVQPSMAEAQTAVLNSVYNPYDISFSLQGSTQTIHDAWAAGATDEDDLAMKQALRTGGYSTLNLYMQTDLAGSILGKCSLPADIGPVDDALPASEYATDGCNVQAQTMPGGSIRGYNMGMTAAHETGHWLGLLHTFEGYACEGDGDFIADTPVQSTSTDGCPAPPGQKPKDSCPDHEGLDAIHNYMDYSTDLCYTGFTPLQKERMAQMWDMYRAGR